MVHELSDASFTSEVLASPAPVFVDFWAPWCGPCHSMEPVVSVLAKEVKGVTFGKLNVDENTQTANAFSIMSIPTFMVFKGGKVIGQVSGTMRLEKLKEFVEKAIR